MKQLLSNLMDEWLLIDLKCSLHWICNIFINIAMTQFCYFVVIDTFNLWRRKTKKMCGHNKLELFSIIFHISTKAIATQWMWKGIDNVALCRRWMAIKTKFHYFWFSSSLCHVLFFFSVPVVWPIQIHACRARYGKILLLLLCWFRILLCARVWCSFNRI